MCLHGAGIAGEAKSKGPGIHNTTFSGFCSDDLADKHSMLA